MVTEYKNSFLSPVNKRNNWEHFNKPVNPKSGVKLQKFSVDASKNIIDALDEIMSSI